MFVWDLAESAQKTVCDFEPFFLAGEKLPNLPQFWDNFLCSGCRGSLLEVRCVCVFCSDLQEFPGLVWCRGKGLFRERGRRRTAATVAGGGGAAAGSSRRLWKFADQFLEVYPGACIQSLGLCRAQKEGEKKITKARRIWEAEDDARRTVVTRSGLKETGLVWCCEEEEEDEAQQQQWRLRLRWRGSIRGEVEPARGGRQPWAHGTGDSVRTTCSAGIPRSRREKTSTMRKRSSGQRWRSSPLTTACTRLSCRRRWAAKSCTRKWTCAPLGSRSGSRSSTDFCKSRKRTMRGSCWSSATESTGI